MFMSLMKMFDGTWWNSCNIELILPMNAPLFWAISNLILLSDCSMCPRCFTWVTHGRLSPFSLMLAGLKPCLDFFPKTKHFVFDQIWGSWKQHSPDISSPWPGVQFYLQKAKRCHRQKSLHHRTLHEYDIPAETLWGWPKVCLYKLQKRFLN